MASTQKLVEKFDARIGFCGRLILWLFALLLLTRFSVVGAALTVAVVAGQVFLGLVFVARYRVLKELSALGRVGLGFCLGVTISTFFYIFVVTFTNRYLAILGQIGLLIVALVVYRFSRDKLALASTDEEKHIIKWIAVVTLLGLSPDWFWPLPVAAVLAASIYIFGRVRGRAIVVRLSAMAVCGAVAGFVWMRILDTRPQRPWFADDRFAEIFSFSLGRWGMSHNPVIVGETVSYHWFSYAWIGAVSNLANVKLELILPLFGPVIIAGVCVILGFAITRAVLSHSLYAILGVACAVFFDTEKLFRGFGFHVLQISSLSQFFSLPFGLVIVLLLAKLNAKELRAIALIIGFVFAGAIGSKSSSGLFVLLGLFGILCVWLLERSEIVAKIRFAVVGVIVPAIISGLIFYGNPLNGAESKIRRPGWPVGVSRDLWDVYNGGIAHYLPILFFLMLAIAGTGIYSLSLIIFLEFGESRSLTLQSFLLCGFVAANLQMWIAQSDGYGNLVGDSDNTLWALQYFVALSLFAAIGMLAKTLIENFRANKFHYIVVSVLLVGLTVSSRKWQIEFRAAYWTPFFESLKLSLPFIFSIIVALLLSTTLYFSNYLSGLIGLRKKFFELLGISIVAIGIFLSVANISSESERQQNEWRSNDQEYIASDDYMAAAQWLRTNSNSVDIVATLVTSSSPKLSELAERREFAGFGSLWRVVGSYSKLESVKRHLIADFSTKGDCDSAKGLRQNDVDFVLVDLTNVETPDVDRCADEVFRNETVVIYSLK